MLATTADEIPSSVRLREERIVYIYHSSWLNLAFLMRYMLELLSLWDIHILFLHLFNRQPCSSWYAVYIYCGMVWFWDAKGWALSMIQNDLSLLHFVHWCLYIPCCLCMTLWSIELYQAGSAILGWSKGRSHTMRSTVWSLQCHTWWGQSVETSGCQLRYQVVVCASVFASMPAKKHWWFFS